MRILTISLAALLAVACGDNAAPALHTDASQQPPHIDAPNTPPLDAFVFLDAPPDPSGLATALGTADGTGLSLPITGVTVTYLKPAIGNLTDDPAGFTVQAMQAGPGMFVTVDPTTTTPALAVGDVINFTITSMLTVDGEHRGIAITDLARTATGTDVSSLARDISSATDVVSNVAAYDSTIIDVTGTFATAFVSSGAGFQSAELNTTGISNNTHYTFRVPAPIVDAQDMASMCTVTATNIPVDEFTTTVELGAYVASDFVMTGCPAPLIGASVSTSSTTATITFTRNIDPATVMANGSQFTSDGGLTITAAAVAGRTITLTTSAQTSAMNYTITIATGLTDLQGSALAAPFNTTFSGFVPQAALVINELNANVTGGCDLIELRVTADGSMGNFKVFERTGVVASGELNFVFPTGFNVHKNDLVMLHLNSASTTCNPNAATQEVTTITDQPVAMFAKNYDTAFDFWATDTGLTATDNVITVYDSTGVIVDAVFLTSGTGATDTLAQADTVAAAGQWLPAPLMNGMYVGMTDYAAAAVAGLGTTGSSVTGTATSIQRLTDADTNGKADWAIVAQTFGTINAGQLTLPKHKRR